jgi:hypothetical protein
MPSMPTPTFALRLSLKTQQELAELAKVYGAPNPRALAREILEVIVSGDIERIKAFNARLITRMGEQLVLRLNAAVDTPAPKHGAHATRTARTARPGRKKRRRREPRTT